MIKKMKNRRNKVRAWVLVLFALLIVGGGVYFLINLQTSSSTGTATTTAPVVANTYGMVQYTDSDFGFSFWYPSALQVVATTTQDNTNFPGGVAVETLQIGSAGGTSVVVVNSLTATITDEPNNHASPIAQTKYFYDNASKQWMVAYPQGTTGPGSGATTTANVSKTTMSNLVILPSGRRFDTTIIPLSTTRFLVISDGGGSSFTGQLAQTVAQVGAPIDSSTQAETLQAEATAYASVNE